MDQQETVQRSDDERLRNDGREEVAIEDRCEKRRPKYLKMEKESAAISHGHLGRITSLGNPIELSSDYVRPANSAPY